MKDKIICEHCGKVLNEKRIAWLELDRTTGSYHFDDVPEEISQGYFPFGKDCAVKVGRVYRDRKSEYVKIKAFMQMKRTHA